MIIIGQSRLLEGGLVLTSSLSTHRYEQSCSQNPNVTAKCRGIVSTFLYLGKYVIVGIPKVKSDVFQCLCVCEGQGRIYQWMSLQNFKLCDVKVEKGSKSASN